MERERQIIYCSKCGAKLNVPGGECLNCKTNMKESSGNKNVIISIFLSFFLSGLGQLYNGQKMKAIIIFLAFLLLPFVFRGAGIIISILIWILGIYDAYITSNYINHGKYTEDTIGDFFKFLR